MPISYPRTSLRSHCASFPKISFSPEPPESAKQKKKKKEKNPKSDCSSPPGLLRGWLKPLLVLHLARILLLGDRGLVLGASGLPPPWALRSFIALLLSC